MQNNESVEHARRRAFKGILGRPHTSRFELASREVRRTRRLAEEQVGERLSAEAKETELSVLKLGKLLDPHEIAKRRARKMKHSPGRYGIRSELADMEPFRTASMEAGV